MTPTPVLIVDDEQLIRWSIARELAERGYEPRQAATGAEARAQLHDAGVVVLDYALPDVDGFELLREIQRAHPEVPVLMLTGHGSIRHAVDAMREGAWHYLHKPVDAEELCELVSRAAASRQRFAPDAGDEAAALLLGRSEAMERTRRELLRLARSGATTLLLSGETGTGKDLAARVVHNASDRREGPLVHVTCSALPATLLESELFGHEKGAFTGAEGRRIGLLEQADGGTVFLDEIGELTPPLQAKLLRFLEDRALRRVGGTEELRADVRVVAATHVNLELAVTEGRFRQDLFYRLAVVEIAMPPLRERPEDVAELARHFLAQLGRRDVELSPGAVRQLEEHRWPGNVRELRNTIERAAVMSAGRTIGEDDLILRRVIPTPGRFVLPPEGLDLEALERDLLVQALERTGGNRTKAAELLGLSRDTVRYRITKFGLD